MTEFAVLVFFAILFCFMVPLPGTREPIWRTLWSALQDYVDLLFYALNLPVT